MATWLVPGPRTWRMSRDSEGHREYKVRYRVRGAKTDGPANALRTPGLPTPGSYWIIDADVDLWAWCRWNAEVTPVVEDGPNTHWEIEFTFGTKPPDTKACKDNQVEDPLLEPQRISGSFIKYTEEATHDRFGQPITNSAWEQMRGPQVEFDANRPQIRIEQNVAVLGLSLFAPMIDCLNDRTLWGLPPRTIKLSNVSWERKFYGSCSVYYTRSLEFDIRYEGFDRDLLDEGTKVLHGRWDDVTGNWALINIGGVPPNRFDPRHFVRFKDRKGENCRVILNGEGSPALIVTGTGKLFISIVDGNLNNELTNAEKWLPLLSPDHSLWISTSDYPRGSIVSYIGALGDTYIYVAIQDNTGLDPFVSPDYWTDLGTLPFVPRDMSNYNAATTYIKGDYVKDIASASAGSRHIEKYGLANFLLLGIPLTF